MDLLKYYLKNLPKHLLSPDIEYAILALNEDLYSIKIFNCVN